MKSYEIIGHTADIGLKVNGETLKKLFENAAKGMFEIIAGEGAHEPITAPVDQKIQIKKEFESFEELLVEWLSELLYIFNKEEILFNSFKIQDLSYDGITGKVSGKKINPANRALQTEIKAVTFHGLKIEEDKTGFNCKIIFDV
ncbi:archease [Candidatus Omnitrophota bacterium]